jgi:hypothetical protein
LQNLTYCVFFQNEFKFENIVFALFFHLIHHLSLLHAFVGSSFTHRGSSIENQSEKRTQAVPISQCVRTSPLAPSKGLPNAVWEHQRQKSSQPLPPNKFQSARATPRLRPIYRGLSGGADTRRKAGRPQLSTRDGKISLHFPPIRPHPRQSLANLSPFPPDLAASRLCAVSPMPP